MQDTDDELREIKREIVESRGLVIKTNHLTNALAADLKTIAKRQLTFERRAFWNSAAANVVVLVVILGSVRVAWNAQQETYKNEARNQKDKLDKLLADQKVEAERQAARLSAEGSAATFYELVRAERRQEVLDGWEGLRKLPLSRAELAFLGDAVERTRAELSVKLYHQGQDHVRSGRWQEAASQLEEALRLDPKAAHSPAAKLALGKALRRLSRQRDAIPRLVELSEASSDREVMDDATFLLAECYADVEAWNEAKGALRQLIRRFPDSPLVNDARMMLADISVKH
jgi:TolA-binding protein